ncbi:uncharacterized protein LOC116007281 isoform X1 [Ipomoea triloba]|uniref:uncharacterized protein LOC116007281 isoform X1 n=1 Tax=Ipomoea triloba TaxID=35885 RepID=UPI00125E1681|nr:uncharacterized protein LOC116007281 isoform X1 [Ipomoea triloba]
MGDLRGPFASAAGKEGPAPSSPSAPNPDPSSIGSERWARAENLTRDIIQNVQPTTEFEERRKALINYIQRLIRDSLHCEVFPYGSVPLKTFLPDGDIDLTAFGAPMLEDGLANDIVYILEREHRNNAADFTVDDVQLISAEVKIVKCIVQNIVVDISFNQIGGLCSLCFLEKVDHIVGKDHLFKRSIILIKAWCYYESRILGAHHGLISTYALETLVLYIFHLFHSSLDGPLAVLYKFLDYFSKFDWENYCVSLTGPVRLSSLPDIVAEAPENGGGDFLLSNDFIRYCVSKFSVPSRGFETNARTFQQKHLNIVDPLKENNNLGRSVSKGNFYRIQSAFTFGARKLGTILLQSKENIADELNKFFENTLLRHGSAPRLGVEDFGPAVGHDSFFPTRPVSGSDSSRMEDVNCKMKSSCLADSTGDCTVKPNGISNEENRDQEGGLKLRQSALPPETVEAGTGNAFGDHLSGDKKQCLTLSNGNSTDFASSRAEKSAPVVGKPFFAPHLCFTKSASNGEMKRESSEEKPPERHGCNEGKGSEQNLLNDKNGALTVVNNARSDDSVCIDRAWPLATGGKSPRALNDLSDLSGDYDYYFRCMQYGRRCYEHLSALPIPPLPPPPFHVKNLSGPVWPPSQMIPNGFPQGSPNGFIPNQMFYPPNPRLVPNAAFGFEEMLKPRGTGTYFPNMNQPPHGYRHSKGGRIRAPLSSPRTNARKPTFTDTYTLDSNYHEMPHPRPAFPHSEVHPAIDQRDVNQSFSPRDKVHPNLNGPWMTDFPPEA